jgi:hypothetical protein
MIMGPNDKRAMRHTGRSWSKGELSGPVMVDGHGHEYEVVEGSVADFTNGRLEQIFEHLGLVDKVMEAADGD